MEQREREGERERRAVYDSEEEDEGVAPPGRATLLLSSARPPPVLGPVCLYTPLISLSLRMVDRTVAAVAVDRE